MRVGMGYDVHQLVEGRDLILGGVRIPYEKGLLGHSDADVLLHAIMVYYLYFYSSLIASTGLMFMALKAGANPAATPIRQSSASDPIAIENDTWK